MQDDLSDAAEQEAAGSDHKMTMRRARRTILILQGIFREGKLKNLYSSMGVRRTPPGVQLLHPTQSFQFVHNGG